jgi:hypothetical protein
MHTYRFCVLTGAGVIILASSLMMLAGERKSHQPGSLVSLEAVQVWRSPNPDSPATSKSRKATFRLTNPGNEVVRVLSTRSGCGCAKPEVRFDHLGPGEVGEVDVIPNLVDIGIKSVPITLTTDSPSTPEVTLTLRLVGSRRPPYLQDARGDLTLRDSIIGTEASFDATTVIPVGMKESLQPIVRSSLSFLKVKLIEIRELPNTNNPDARFIYHTYRVIIDSQPPDLDFGGEIVVTDPWNSDRFFALHLTGSVEPPLRAIPAILRLGAEGDTVRLTIAARRGVGELRVEQEAGDPDVLSIEQVGSSERFAVFAVRRRERVAAPGMVVHLAITAGGPQGTRMVVPVQLGEGGRP